MIHFDLNVTSLQVVVRTYLETILKPRLKLFNLDLRF